MSAVSTPLLNQDYLAIELEQVHQTGRLKQTLVRQVIQQDLTDKESALSVISICCIKRYASTQQFELESVPLKFRRILFIPNFMIVSSLILTGALSFSQLEVEKGTPIFLACTISAAIIHVTLFNYIVPSYRIYLAREAVRNLQQLKKALETIEDREDQITPPDTVARLLPLLEPQKAESLLMEASVRELKGIVDLCNDRGIEAPLTSELKSLQKLFANPPDEINHYLDLLMRAQGLLKTDDDYAVLRDQLPCGDSRRQFLVQQPKHPEIQDAAPSIPKDSITFVVDDESIEVDQALLQKHFWLFAKKQEFNGRDKVEIGSWEFPNELVKILHHMNDSYSELLTSIPEMPLEDCEKLFRCALFYRFEEILLESAKKLFTSVETTPLLKVKTATAILSSNHFKQNQSEWIDYLFTHLKRSNNRSKEELTALLDLYEASLSNSLIPIYCGYLSTQQNLGNIIIHTIYHRNAPFTALRPLIFKELCISQEHPTLTDDLFQDTDFMNWYGTKMEESKTGLLKFRNFRLFFDEPRFLQTESVKKALKNFTCQSREQHKLIQLWETGQVPELLFDWIRESKQT